MARGYESLFLGYSMSTSNWGIRFYLYGDKIEGCLDIKI
jgi:hypothetical protein